MRPNLDNPKSPFISHPIRHLLTSHHHGAFGSLDVILQHDVRFLESLIHGITSWEYKITMFGSLVTF